MDESDPNPTGTPCNHDFTYDGVNIICYKCGYKIENTESIADQIYENKKTFNLQEYKRILESIKSEIIDVSRELEKTKSILTDPFNVENEVSELINERDSNWIHLCTTQDENKALCDKISELEAEIELYKNKSAKTNNIFNNDIIDYFISFVSEIYTQNLRLPDKDDYEQNNIYTIKNNINSSLEKLIYSLKNKDIFINHNEVNKPPTGQWPVVVVATEETGKRILDNCIKCSKKFSCTSNSLEINIKEEVVQYKYNRDKDDSITDCELTIELDDTEPLVIPYKTGDSVDISQYKCEPPKHHRFVGWAFEKNGICTSSNEFTIEKSCTIYPIFEKEKIKLKLELIDSSNGKIIKNHTEAVPYGDFSLVLPVIPDYARVPNLEGNISEFYKEGDLFGYAKISYSPLSVKYSVDKKYLAIINKKNESLGNYFSGPIKNDIFICFNEVCTNKKDNRRIFSISCADQNNQEIDVKLECDDLSKTSIIIHFKNQSGTPILDDIKSIVNHCEIYFERHADTTKYTFKNPKVKYDAEKQSLICTYDRELNKYPITWVLGINRTINYEEVGSIPKYTDELFLKAPAGKINVFKGWKERIVPVNGYAIYNAIFQEMSKEDAVLYMIKNGNDTIDKMHSVTGISEKDLEKNLNSICKKKRITRNEDGTYAIC